MIRWYERWRKRRHDKLRLWVLLIVGVSIPICICWGIPNVLASQRERRAAIDATATAAAGEAFRAEHGEFFALCDAPVPDTATGTPSADPRVLVLQNETISDLQAGVPENWQPDPAFAHISVVVCLEREIAQSIDLCSNGEAPDLSQFESVLGDPDIPPDQVRVTRYFTESAIYEAQTGTLIAEDTLVGADPTICADPVQGDFNGERLTPDEFRTWLVDAVAR